MKWRVWALGCVKEFLSMFVSFDPAKLNGAIAIHQELSRGSDAMKLARQGCLNAL
jgi:hypothetical protein